MPIPQVSHLFGPPILVGVDAGSRFIKVVEVHARSRFRFRVKGYASVPTPEGAYTGGVVQDPVALGRAIREAIRQAGIRRRSAAIAVNPQVAFLRKLSFPVMPEPELRNIIQLQPDRYLPIAATEEAQFDLSILPGSPGDEQMSVILAAAPRRTVENLQRACRVAGLKPVLVDLEPLALHRAVLALTKQSVTGVTAIVDLGGIGAKISLFDGHVPLISRVLNVEQTGEPAGESALSGTTDLFLDIRRSLEYGLSQAAGPLATVYLTGGGAVDEYTAVAMSGYLRGFMSHRLTPNFEVVPLHHQFVNLSRAFMLAVGLSLPQELFNDSYQSTD